MKTAHIVELLVAVTRSVALKTEFPPRAARAGANPYGMVPSAGSGGQPSPMVSPPPGSEGMYNMASMNGGDSSAYTSMPQSQVKLEVSQGGYSNAGGMYDPSSLQQVSPIDPRH
ncbi:unnamed protein product [Notodromas monacha]|uniref:Uncharacterized protein n=1 Tax=Notodromas monacha TaxID=399045 RepID=A0A7R9BV78_9CRUS|nr:unnamed protein product [Notodromas monacha]CAG0922002.1 unnamed protein product [Notodromas monacha]